MNTKQTAVEWFLSEFEKQICFEFNSELDIWIKELIPKAKEMQKEQMKAAYCEGSKLIECPNELSASFDFFLYYIETYEGDDK